MHCSDCLWFQHGICIMQFDWEEPVTEDTDICCEFDKKFNQKRKTHNELNNTLTEDVRIAIYKLLLSDLRRWK